MKAPGYSRSRACGVRGFCLDILERRFGIDEDGPAAGMAVAPLRDEGNSLPLDVLGGLDLMRRQIRSQFAEQATCVSLFSIFSETAADGLRSFQLCACAIGSMRAVFLKTSTDALFFVMSSATCG